MWATSSLSNSNKNTRQGFTIVELLIVIVVIAILAAITIVAYNGITQRARVATVSSDLEGAAKQLAIDQTLNSAYPATVAAANNGAGLKASAGTTYQYAVNNTVSPQTFCITATNGTTSYYASSTNNVPTAGACAGQGSGGVAAITNLITNPSFEGGTTGWAAYGTSTNYATSSISAYAGPTSVLLTEPSVGGYIGYQQISIPVSAGVQYTGSAYVNRSSGTSNIVLRIEWDTSAYAFISGNQTAASSTTAPIGQWSRLTQSAIAPANATMAVLILAYQGASSGESFYGDALMFTQSSTTYNYADGSSPNWIWNGAANASTSTGPPL